MHYCTIIDSTLHGVQYNLFCTMVHESKKWLKFKGEWVLLFSFRFLLANITLIIRESWYIHYCWLFIITKFFKINSSPTAIIMKSSALMCNQIYTQCELEQPITARIFGFVFVIAHLWQPKYIFICIWPFFHQYIYFYICQEMSTQIYLVFMFAKKNSSPIYSYSY